MNKLILERDDDGTFIFSAEVNVVYGHGDSLGEAWNDYIASLKEYIELVDGELPSAGAVREGAELRAHLHALTRGREQ